MAQSILELIFKTSKQGQGGKAASQELRDLKSTVGEASQGLLGFNVASFTAVGAVVAVTGAVSKAVTDYQAYAESMRGMAAITGTGVEETSRLVQTFDDLGISQETLSSVMSTAAKKGFVATIDNVVKLADQYNSLSKQEDKNKLLTDTLGKSGLLLAKAFEQGGEKMRDLAAAQADGMLITAKQADEAERLRVAQDNLNDSWTAASNQIAQAVVPALTDYLNVTAEMGEPIDSWGDALKRLGPVQAVTIIQGLQQAKMMREAEEAAIGVTEQGFLYAKMTSGVEIPALTDVASGWMALPPAMQAYITAADASREATEKLDTELTDKLNKSMQTYSTQLQFQIASEGLSADQKLRLAAGMGLIDEKSKYAIVKTQEWQELLRGGKISIEQYQHMVAQLANDLQRIESKDVYVRTHLITIDENNPANRRVGGQVDLNSANGTVSGVVPPGHPNDSFLIGLTSGEEYSVTNDRMRWTGEGGGGGGGGGPAVIIQQVVISNGMDMATFEAKLTDVLRRI